GVSGVGVPTRRQPQRGCGYFPARVDDYLSIGFAHMRPDGRILEPPPDRGCVRRTSRSKCGCAKSLNDSKTRGLAVALWLVLRTQPRSVSARFWWWFQDAPALSWSFFPPLPLDPLRR